MLPSSTSASTNDFAPIPTTSRLASSTQAVISAVEDAVSEGRRLVVTSGGHCLEGFVSDPDVRVIIDVSPMKRIYYDAAMRAMAVEAGATVGETFRALFETWGVVVPLGEYPGDRHGRARRRRRVRVSLPPARSRRGLSVRRRGGDGGREGRASSVVATREASDPNRDLWWAHTGGGGGNFGIVTRYWFRSPDATGDDPAKLLPRAPDSITTFKAEWSWSDIDQSSFLRLLRNHGSWCERNSGADSPNASLWALLEIHRKQFGKIIVRGVSTAGRRSRAADRRASRGAERGIVAPSGRALARMSWLDFALNPMPELFAMPPGGVSVKVKDALLRKRFTDRQIGVAYDYLTRTDHDVMGGMLGLATYGGRVNTVARDATASVQRECDSRHGVQHGLARSARSGRRISRGCVRSIASCSRTPAAFPFPARRTMGRSSIIPTSILRTPR